MRTLKQIEVKPCDNDQCRFHTIERNISPHEVMIGQTIARGMFVLPQVLCEWGFVLDLKPHFV